VVNASECWLSKQATSHSTNLVQKAYKPFSSSNAHTRWFSRPVAAKCKWYNDYICGACNDDKNNNKRSLHAAYPG